ncbi:MAG: response regulator transcription factor [Deltaproteobacteria bacterium]
MRVLVVEDYSPIRLAVRDGLAEQGYAVDVASNGEDGLWLAEQNPYDVIVLDVMLPKVDGLEIVKRLRAKGSQVGVLMLTARDTVADRVTGLDHGADDYLVKPFELSELFARVRALVRRGYAAKDPVIRVSDLVIDTVKRAVKRGEAVVALSPREYALLEYLAIRAGEVVTRTEIWEHVYDFRSDAQSNVVDVYVSYLRKKLGQPALIHTRRGYGYVLGDDA